MRTTPQLSLLTLSLAGLALAQAPIVPQNRDAPVTPVPFDRILKADKEPQNWLTYSGTTMSQRYSGLNQITPANAKDYKPWTERVHYVDIPSTF